ncbi:conjugal transfer protein, partial [Salmonella enterica subsp. enterica serovar Enteritidis]|nr:conjugal transfer protein [Salmonella enterica subsp. enterica serovar Enteritidis]
MKMNKGALIMALLMAAHVCNAAVLPSGSRFDPRNQIVSYNPNKALLQI